VIDENRGRTNSLEASDMISVTDGRNRRIADVADRGLGRLNWAGKRTYRVAREGAESARSRHRSRRQQNIVKGGLGSFEADTRDGLKAQKSALPDTLRTGSIDPERQVFHRSR